MDIKKVIVVHKTHLDIGFTDSAENVMHKYLETFSNGSDCRKACVQFSANRLGEAR